MSEHRFDWIGSVLIDLAKFAKENGLPNAEIALKQALLAVRMDARSVQPTALPPPVTGVIGVAMAVHAPAQDEPGTKGKAHLRIVS